MEELYGVLVRVSKALNAIGALALTLAMLMTVADVVGRAAGHPIIGTYELVSLSLAVIIGFGIPMVSLDKGHVQMEIIQEKLSPRGQDIMNTFTRILCILLFALIGFNLIGVGREFHVSGEVSPTIRLPFYPVPYGVAICCFLECFVFVFEIVKIWGGKK